MKLLIQQWFYLISFYLHTCCISDKGKKWKWPDWQLLINILINFRLAGEKQQYSCNCFDEDYSITSSIIASWAFLSGPKTSLRHLKSSNCLQTFLSRQDDTRLYKMSKRQLDWKQVQSALINVSEGHLIDVLLSCLSQTSQRHLYATIALKNHFEFILIEFLRSFLKTINKRYCAKFLFHWEKQE